MKSAAKTLDYTRPTAELGYIWRTVGDGGGGRVVNAVRATLGAKELTELTAQRCERGAEIAGMLELPNAVAEAIRSVEEHWNGRGHPLGLAGDEIPLFGRILALAQAVEVYASRGGVESALAMARNRAGRWYDPELVAALDTLEADSGFWESLATVAVEEQVGLVEPVDLRLAADDDRLDRVAEAFALVIDSKSP